jgi:hypothetical protein
MTTNTTPGTAPATLPDYCLGLLPAPNNTTTPCSRRGDCERYQYRHHSPGPQAVAQWLCPGRDTYWPGHLPMGAKSK